MTAATGTALPRAETSARDTRLDRARGVAMVFVVLGHALVGLKGAGFDTPLLRFALIAIYSTHMALFFLVSGLLSTSLAALPWTEVLRRLTQRLLWPYLLWSLMLYSLHFQMSAVTNTAIETFAPWRILCVPPSVMWFLYVLIASLLLLRWLAPGPRWLTFGMALCILCVAYSPLPAPDYLRWVGVVLLAAAGGRQMVAALARPAGYAVAGLVMVATLLMAWGEAQSPAQGYPAADTVYIPALIAGPLLVYGLCGAVDRGAVARLLAVIGRRSMAIFVTHILITAGTRILLLRVFDIDSWSAVVLLGTLLGIALPLLADAGARRLGIAAVLGWR